MDLLQPLSQLPFQKGEIVQALPIAIPAAFGMVVLVLDLYLGRKSKTPLALLTLLGSALAGISALALWQGHVPQVVLAGSMTSSAFGAALAIPITLACGMIGLSIAHHGQAAPGGMGEEPHELNRTLAHGEFFALLLFATSGMLALAVANDLVTFFVAIETLSIAVYCLTGIDRREPRSAEAAMKYFVLGAFSAGFLLYGMSLLYGATGSLRLDLIAQAEVPQGTLPLATAGGVLILIGLLFKLGAVPFHAWTPDAYEGAPSAVTGFMSVGVKVAAVGGSLAVLKALGACGALGGAGAWVLWGVAALTTILGNAGALTQRNPRRLLAYSGIAHTGYLLVGLVAVARAWSTHLPSDTSLVAAKDAASGVLFYLIAYALANLGAFAVICHLERKGEDIESIDDLAGLAHTQPKVAVVMTLSMLSLAGIPGTAGFLGKLWVFRAGVASGDVGLVVLALLASAISLYYYLNVVVIMFMREAHAGTAGATAEDPQRWCSNLAVRVTGVLTVLLGIYPTGWLLTLVANGGESLL